MDETTSEQAQKIQKRILEKARTHSVSSLQVEEVCFTLMWSSFAELYQEATGLSWSSQLEKYFPKLVLLLETSNTEKALRFQAGQVFLKALDSFSVSVAKPKANLKDYEVIERLKENLRDNSKSFLGTLTEMDLDGDGHVTKSELVTCLEDLEMAPQDIVALITIAGFKEGVTHVPIAALSEILLKNEKEAKQEKLLLRVFNALCRKGRKLKDVFRFLDTNKDGEVTLQEMRNGLNRLCINLNYKDCKTLFNIFDIDKSGSISLDELHSRLRIYQPKEEFQTPDSLNGTLTVMIVKGLNLPPESKCIRLKLGNLPDHRTPEKLGASPVWKYKAVFAVQNTDLVPNQLILEVLSGSRITGVAELPVYKCFHNPDQVAIKTGVNLRDLSGKKSGAVLVQCKWQNSVAETENSQGELSMQLVRGKNLPSSYFEFRLNEKVVSSHMGPVWGQSVKLVPVAFDSGQVLSVRGYSSFDDRLFALKEIPMSYVFAKPNRKLNVELKLTSSSSLLLHLEWRPLESNEETEVESAVKIQSLWRRMIVQNQYKKIQEQNKRLLGRESLKSQDRVYAVSFYSLDSQRMQLELHPADTVQAPLNLVLHKLILPFGDIKETLQTLSVTPYQQLTQTPSQKSARGNLSIQVLSYEGLEECWLRFEVEGLQSSVKVHKSNQVHLERVCFVQQPQNIKLGIYSESKELMLEKQLYWLHAVAFPLQWTEPFLCRLKGDSYINFQYKWESLPTSEEEKEAVQRIQTAWKQLSLSEVKALGKLKLVKKTTIRQHDRVFCVCLRENQETRLLQLHIADDPLVPAFEVLDSIEVPFDSDSEQLFESVNISEDRKLSLVN